MALHVPRAPGFSSMMKDGAKFFSGLEEAVIRNIGNKLKMNYHKWVFRVVTSIYITGHKP